ncbi:hypothetical protein CROQUDRAFT_402809 [Cronartium quercuum f. sp. fusiforme G11]|uniref:Uncharacterized protein n=1 Tax=Cronartium quercuum f. sp. fusiforme G11 TaxID=708437 RepID=A0A9P6TIK3_9BASI|nr:hypothetical protein CROQUDRAFT_402809 [Cronartium quercuum f. sp. fusiforme G11]
MQFEARYELPQPPVSTQPPQIITPIQVPRVPADPGAQASPVSPSRRAPSPLILTQTVLPELCASPTLDNNPTGVLFTSSYPSKQGSVGSQSLEKSLYHLAENSMRLGMVGDQWVVVWEVQGNIAPINATYAQPITLSLSSVVSYAQASSLSKSYLPSSCTGSGRAANDEDVHLPYTDLLEGLGLDTPMPASCLISAHPLAKPGNPQGKRAGLAVRSKTARQPVRSTSNSLPATSGPPLVSSLTSIETEHPGHDRRSSAPTGSLTPTVSSSARQVARSSGMLKAEKRHKIDVSVVDALSITVRTAVIRHDTKSATAFVPSQRPNMIEKQPEGQFMISLEIENTTNKRGGGNNNQDFVVEEVRVEVRRANEEVGCGPRQLRIKPCVSDTVPRRVCAGGTHSLVYGVRAEAREAQWSAETKEVLIPPSTPISDVNVAFRHQRQGISLDQYREGEYREEMFPSANSILESAGETETPSTVWLGPQSQPKTRSHVNSSTGDPSQAAQDRSFRSGSTKYVISVEIKAQLVSNAVGSGPRISSRWKAVLDPHARTRPSKVDCQREGTHLSTSQLRSAVDELDKPLVISPTQPTRQASLVGGSRKHTASHLAGALSTLSSFQQHVSLTEHSPPALTLQTSDPNGPQSQKQNQYLSTTANTTSSAFSTPLASPSLASFSRRLMHSISPSNSLTTYGGDISAGGLTSSAVETVREARSERARSRPRSPDPRGSRSGNGSGLAIRVRLVTGTEEVTENRVRIGQTFWVEVLVVNRLGRRVGLELGLEEGGTGDLVALDDGVLIGFVLFSLFLLWMNDRS